MGERAVNVAVVCEYSGVVRDAFIAAGHNAVSFDLLPTERPGPHVQGDVRAADLSGFNVFVCHPPCTRLCNSGVRWLGERNLWAELDEAAAFFRWCLDLPGRVCIENPIQHKHAKGRIKVPHTQIIQPWQFGHGETKATCLWLKELPPLLPTNIVDGRSGRIHKMPPGPDRSKERSRTYPGIAAAMAEQWGQMI